MAELVRTVNFAETFAALRLGESVEFSVAEFTGKSSVSCPLKPSDSAPLC